MNPGILLIALIGMLGLGALGFFLVRFVNHGLQDKTPEVDEEKLQAWTQAMERHDPVKAQEESMTADSEAYVELKRLKLEIETAMPPYSKEMYTCQSLEDYKAFDAKRWAADNLDQAYAREHLVRLEQIQEIYLRFQDDMDKAGTMTCDEPDERTREACWQLFDHILALFPAGLDVTYTYNGPDVTLPYQNTQIIGIEDLRKLAGQGPDCRDGLCDARTAAERHALLKEAGYRCHQCGRSPLSGGKLNVWRAGSHVDCLCERCRRV